MCESVSGNPASKYPLVLLESEDFARTLPLSLLSHRIIIIRHCSSKMTKDHFLVIFYGIKGSLSFDVALNTHSFIHSHFSWCNQVLLKCSVGMTSIKKQPFQPIDLLVMGMFHLHLNNYICLISKII